MTDEFEGIISASRKTEAELAQPEMMLRPMKYSDWFLRTMILEFPRRNRVLDGRADPTPNEPWRICDPAELKAWLKTLAQGRGRAAAAGKDKDR